MDNSGVRSLKLIEVTGGEFTLNNILTGYLSGANAATVNMGFSRQTAVLLAPNFFSQSHPETTLVHEIVFHGYAAQIDDNVFGNAYFTTKGLWRPANSTATTNISTWMGTDCTCTPGNPAVQSCPTNTANWLK